jgi:murein DD-endopeptidase MepM/ murein hydrolase activator NlpD
MPAASPRLLPNSATTQSVPAPLQPDRAQRQSLPSKRFDASLEDLMRDGVVSRREVRVHAGLIANPDLLRQGCSNGAFSARECGASGGGVQFRARADGGGGGGGVADGFSGSAGGERYGIDAAPLPPISVPVTALLSGAGGSFRLTDVFQRTPRPASIRGNGNARPIFPLIGGAEISSGFGWRLHPILGTWMMHSGRDLAAPEGTPVVAALSGRVVSSGDAGGYGLAIELEHDNPRRRTLYGHLSELYVREGDRIRQGEVIGRVGSTGRSTGPHLHFELRTPQEGGWVAVDPGELDPGGGVQVAGAALPGLAGLLSSSSGAPTDAVALLMGQLIQSLERPRSPLAPAAEFGRSGLASPAASSDRLPQRLPAAAALPGPAPLPRNLPATPTPGQAPSQRPNRDG